MMTGDQAIRCPILNPADFGAVNIRPCTIFVLLSQVQLLTEGRQAPAGALDQKLDLHLTYNYGDRACEDTEADMHRLQIKSPLFSQKHKIENNAHSYFHG
jgi:hypothetical protein